MGVQVRPPPAARLQPAVPAIAGLTPLIQRSGHGTPFALFAVSRDGLDLLRGRRRRRGDGGRLLAASCSWPATPTRTATSTASTARWSPRPMGSRRASRTTLGADANRDGIIDAADVQLLGANLGFLRSTAAAGAGTAVLTHAGLPVHVRPGASQPTRRAIRCSSARRRRRRHGDPEPRRPHRHLRAGRGLHRHGRLPLPGRRRPRPSSAATTVTVTSAPRRWSTSTSNRAAAPRRRRRPAVVAGRRLRRPEGRGARPRPTSPSRPTDPSVAAVSAPGRLRRRAHGTTRPDRLGRRAPGGTAVTVGVPTDALGLRSLQQGPRPLSAGGVAEQRRRHAADRRPPRRRPRPRLTDLAPAASGTQYFLSRPGVVTVSADGLMTAVAPGSVTVTVIHGPAEARRAGAGAGRRRPARFGRARPARWCRAATARSSRCRRAT